MKKCILIPDSYKGTMSAVQICEIMERAVHARFSDCAVHSVPVADGGEGTVDCFVRALAAQRVEAETTGPFGEALTAQYARLHDTAVIEMASAAGLPLAEGRLNPRRATMYGVGTLIRHAAEHGCRKIVLGLGGSCTNDGGIGMARALGAEFYGRDGKAFAPYADEMTEISRIDCTAVRSLLHGIEVIAMCDVDNPLCGENGASYVFAPQKGADDSCVKLLDENLRALAEAMECSGLPERFGIPDIARLSGAGAAGGMGAGVAAFLGGRLQSGIETVLDLVQFDAMLDGADLVFTGEGRIDGQSLRGKAVMGVAAHAARKNVPVVAVAGSIGDGAEALYDCGVTAMFSINRRPMAFSEARGFSAENLEKTMCDILRLYDAGYTRLRTK